MSEDTQQATPIEPIPYDCDDCGSRSSADHTARASQTLAIPASALTGFPNGKSPRDLTRRRLIAEGIAGVASVYAATRLDWSQVFEAAVAEADAMQKSLVVIYLQGGNDGLNVTVPVDTMYTGYQAARSNIARVVGPSAGGKVGTWAMGGTGGSLGFANVCVSTAGTGDNGDPTLGFDSLYGDGLGGAGSDLAVFPAADYTPSNHSHFESADIWFGGSIQQEQTGWLGRWLDQYGSQANPLQAVSIDQTLSKQIRTSTAPVCALQNLRGARFDVPGIDRQTIDPTAVMSTLAGVPVGAGNTHLARARGSYATTVDMANRLATLTNIAAGAGYPAGSYLSSQLQTAAVLLGAGLGTRLVTIDWGGFDTHGGQLASQDPQLKELSRSMAAFKADLTARGIEQNVLTLVFSEFGRRVGSNESGGTDHGAGGMMLVSGSAVKGGLAGEFPTLPTTDLTGSDLTVKTDFRSVYQAIIGQWLGGDPNVILPGGPFAGIQRYDGGTSLLKAA
ncbi:MAG TPA: DUF1501 domain-containing protein [Gaiellales bacterium]